MSHDLDAVAFDLDGTLYPNYRLNIRLLPFLLKHWPLLVAFGRARDRIRSEQEQDPSAFRDDFYDYQGRLTAERLNAPAQQTCDTIERLIYRGWERHFLHVRLLPHVTEMLARLKAAGLRRGLLSDFPPQTKLNNLGIADWWDAVLCSEATGALKPATRPLACLAEALGCDPGRILYVGNSYRYDVLGAKRAGMKTALLTGRRADRAKPGADFTFSDYRNLCDFVLN
jgi:putative hydrolase of the HAD superfamily